MGPFTDPYFWMAVGFAGQGLFTARFLVQWLASERSGEVVVPTAFWWLSIIGAAAMLAYAISRRDPVVIAGQATGFVVYARNLMLGKGVRERPEGAPIAPASATPAPHFDASGPAGPAPSRARADHDDPSRSERGRRLSAQDGPGRIIA
ncbi:lipid-A-disaccharide synthase N-terminal domain-containing protein [Paludisphaera sp.]|uniref:lipid-A-disaccharide synthase N-terminal domain-containing protein n=1 Tax=Paludisphaera sp. TaxID=2017432 RepID=UPI00301DC2CA